MDKSYLDYKKALSMLHNLQHVERAINKQYIEGNIDQSHYSKLISDLSLQRQNLSLFIEASQKRYQDPDSISESEEI